MRLRDVFDPELIKVKLDSTSRDEVIKELVSMLALDRHAALRQQQIRSDVFRSTRPRRGVSTC